MAIFGQPVPSSGDPGAVSDTTTTVDATATPSDSTAPPAEQATQSAPAAQYLDSEAMGGHLVKVKVNGADVEVPLKDAIGGYMRQEDYTRKTQELSDAKRRLSQADALAAALDSDPIGTLKQLAEAYDVDPSNGFQKAEVDPVQQQLRATQSQVQQLQQATVKQQIQAEADALRAKYGEFDMAAVANYAVENQTTLTNAYKLMNFDTVRQSAPTTAEQNRARALSAQSVEGGASTQPGSVVEDTKPAATFREAYLRAKKQHGVT